MFRNKLTKYKTITFILICALSVFGLSSCKGKTEEPAPAETAEKTEEISGTEESGTKPDENPPADEKPDAKTEEVKEEAAGAFSEAFEKGLVHNNGSYFVRIDDKVYFRNIPMDSMEEGAIFGDFLGGERNTKDCPLLCYDTESCTWEEVGKISGVGKLFACPGGFYIGDVDEEGNYTTYFFDLKIGEESKYYDGSPLGVSDSGELLAVEQYTSSGSVISLIKDGKEIAGFGNESLYYEYCGFAGETLIVLSHDQDGECVLCSVDEKGEMTELGPVSMSGYPCPEQLEVMKDDVYLLAACYEGTGHFLSEWKTFKATPGVKDSIEDYENGKDEYYEESGADDAEGPEEAVPKICFDTGGNLFYSGHQPYKAYMGSPDNGRDNLYYYNDIYDKCLLVKDFIDNDYGDTCSIVQDITSDTDTVFVIYADVEADPEYDIGWRTGYRRTGWHICAIPYGYGHEDENGQAKEILELNSDTPAQTEEIESFSGNMSEADMRKIERKLNSIGYYGFLHGTYNDPTGVRWDEVFYVGAGLDADNGFPSKKIVDEYLKETGDEELFTDLTVVSGQDVRDYVKKTTGHDYSEMKYPLTWTHLRKYDLYAFQHGDTNQSMIKVISANFENGEYKVCYESDWGDRGCVTFVDKNGSYRFISNLPIKGSSGMTEYTYLTEGMLIPDSDSRKLTESDLSGFDVDELRIVRNEIYARHGRKFTDKKLQEHFDSMSWYVPRIDAKDFDEGILNDIEIYNLDLISKYEKKKR